MSIIKKRKPYIKKVKYFKNKYIICLYDEEDNLINQFNNIRQFSKYYRIDKNKINTLIWLHSNNKVRFTKFNEKKLHIELVEVR